jgi:hypothetical protein
MNLVLKAGLLAGLAGLAINAEAIEFGGNGGKILSQKTWTTGPINNADASFTPAEFTMHPAPSIGVSATVPDVSGASKTNTYVRGTHQWYVANPGGGDEDFTVTYRICADVAAQACLFQQTHFLVNAGGTVRDSTNSAIAQYFDHGGQYTSLALTELSGPQQAHAEKNGKVNIS